MVIDKEVMSLSEKKSKRSSTLHGEDGIAIFLIELIYINFENFRVGFDL